MKAMILFVTLFSVQAFAKQQVGLIYADEETRQACVVQNHQSIEGFGLQACSQEESAEALEMNQWESNPQVAGAGAMVIEGILSYYSLCSLFQFAPNLMDAGKNVYNNHLSPLERIKDTLTPSQDMRRFNELRKDVSSVSETVTATVCLPVGALNKKLIKIYNEN